MRSLLTVCLALVVPSAAGATADWLQFGFDAQHSGVNAAESFITRANLYQLHPLYHVTLPSAIDGSPIFLAGVSTASGRKDLVFLTTKDGRLMALNAANGATIWSQQPATGPNYTTTTPAVDHTRQFVYSYGLDGKVHKYQVGDGTEIMTGGWPQLATLKPSVEKSASALAIAMAKDGNEYLYVANGGYPGDAGDYQGHVTTINLGTGAQTVFNAACSNQALHFALGVCAKFQSAVWARAGVVYDANYGPTTDRIFFGTGNGRYDANSAGFDWGDSLISLAPAGTGAGGVPLDSYTPIDFQALQDTDADFGSTAPAIVPTLPSSRYPHMGVQSGKDGKLRLLNLRDMSGMGAARNIGGELQLINVPQGGGVLTQPVAWVNPGDGSAWVFVANDSGISGLGLAVDAAGTPAMASRWTRGSGGSSPVVANGILYYVGSAGVSALDPASGNLLWSNSGIGGIHWQSPIVVNGKVFVTDQSGLFWAFGVPKDLGVYRPSNSRFLLDFNFDHVPDQKVPFGAPGDVGVVGDIDGDGMTDLVLYRNGVWYIDNTRSGSANPAFTAAFGGGAADIPLVGDMNGEGKADLIIFRGGTWYVCTTPCHGSASLIYGFGAPGDVPLVGDVNGDGKLDLIVYRNGIWYVSSNRDGVADIVVAFGGLPQDIPTVFDYDGDGRDDLVILRDGIWYICTKLDGAASAVFSYGTSGDRPLAGVYH